MSSRSCLYWCLPECNKLKTVLTFLGRPVIPQEKKHRLTKTLSLVPQRACPRGERAPVSPCLHPCPHTHGEIRAETAQGGGPASPTLIRIDERSTYNMQQCRQQHRHTTGFCFIYILYYTILLVSNSGTLQHQWAKTSWAGPVYWKKKLNVLRSRLLRRTSSAFSPTSHLSL